MKQCLLIFVIGSLLTIDTGSFCQSMIDQEKRSTIVEVDGYTFLSEDKTIREIKQEALSNAKKEALQRAQTYIQSITKVENYVLTYDLIQSEAQGFVRILESKDYGITSDNRYHYWIKAEVNYTINNSSDDIPFDIATKEKAPLIVRVWTEKMEYISGEKVRIFLKGNKDFYARVVYQDASGNILQLLPNQHRKDSFFEGNKKLAIPGKDDRFELEVTPPFGKEYIIVYASNAVLGKTSVDRYRDGLYLVRGSLDEFAMKSRGLKVIGKNSGNDGAEFYEVKFELNTKPRNEH